MTAHLRARPLAVGALALVALEAAVASFGERFPALSLFVLLVAPGLAWLPLLPARTLEPPTAALAAAPALGLAVSSVVLVSLSSVDIPLTGTSVRIAVAASVALAAAALPGYEPARFLTADGPRLGPLPRSLALTLLGLGAAVLVGAILQGRVVSGSPLPGNDWAKYVLYADEIRLREALLIQNPFWMLGVPFREEPGVPALYGAFLELGGESAPVVAHGIWVFAIFQILAFFAWVRSFWSDAAGVVAAGLWAVLPINQNMLGWHGLANTAALALLPIVLLYTGSLVRAELTRRAAIGFGLVLVAVAATHRLSFIVAGATVALAVAAALALAARADRRRVIGGAVETGVSALVLCPLVAYDLIERNRTFGGTIDYKEYLTSKLDLTLLARDLTPPFAAVAIAACVYLAIRARRERALWPAISLLVVSVVLTYAWLVHLPLVYLRMAYYVPLALAPLVAIALFRVLRARVAIAAGIVLIAVAAGFAWYQAPRVREFYAFANPTSLQGLDAVAAQVRPDEVVVTDRCWSFLGTWLVHARTLPALEPIDIQPKAELPLATRAKEILAGTPRGRDLARRLKVRFLLVDPGCIDAEGRPAKPPAVGRPVFVSKRLVVLRLGAG